MAINKVILSGRLTADPELRITTSGLSVCNFSVAWNAGKDTADFFEAVAWRETAEFLTKYFRKGDGIEIVGQLKSKTYTTKEGNKRKSYEVVCENISFPPGRAKGQGEKLETRIEEAEDDELPF